MFRICNKLCLKALEIIRFHLTVSEINKLLTKCHDHLSELFYLKNDRDLY